MPISDLYDDLVAAGVPTASHESDLYVLDTSEARALIAQHGRTFERFRGADDGKAWLDVPFAYSPWWRARESGR